MPAGITYLSNIEIFRENINCGVIFSRDVSREILHKRDSSLFKCVWPFCVDTNRYLFHEDAPLSYRNQSTDLLCKSMDKFLYDRDPSHERVKGLSRPLHERTYFQRNDKPKEWLPFLYLFIVQNQVAFVNVIL